MIAQLLALTLGTSYDPMRVPDIAVRTVDQTWRDSDRRRDVPVRIYLPAESDHRPVLFFSHGLGGSRENNRYLGEHLARRGFVVIFLQHPGSDEGVWKDVPMRQRMRAMQSAASTANLRLRVDDVHFAIDELVRRSTSDGTLKGRVKLSQVGMFGHSFGAATTQAVSGQSFPLVGTSWTDARIRASVMYSPNAARDGRGRSSEFESVKVPWLLMTGTLDDSPIGRSDAADRLKVFPGLPKGNKYECVLNEATHMAFGERELTQGSPRNANHHRVILALTTAFFEAHVSNSSDALKWLQGSGPRSVMEPKDTWRKK
jgi:predicted dienelactone hydrolase